MIAVDTNILVYAHREDSPFHDDAYRTIVNLARGQLPWAVPWPCLHEFFAIVTHPRIYDPPTPLARVLDQIEAWLEAPTLLLLAESELHWRELRSLIENARVTGPLVHDARIAALCLQHGVRELWSADRDFGRFSRLKVVNPLVATAR
jgi:toxin-antitoxin system PIN domain toxin